MITYDNFFGHNATQPRTLSHQNADRVTKRLFTKDGKKREQDKKEKLNIQRLAFLSNL